MFFGIFGHKSILHGKWYMVQVKSKGWTDELTNIIRCDNIWCRSNGYLLPFGRTLSSRVSVIDHTTIWPVTKETAVSVTKDASPAAKKESALEYLTRNMRNVVRFLPDPESRHMNALNERVLPIIIVGGAYSWKGFLQFVWSWCPVDDGTAFKTQRTNEWSVGLNPDHRDGAVVLKEMETALFLCHYLNALVTNSKISVAWAKLEEDNPNKEWWLYESIGLLRELEEVEVDQWKAVQEIGKKMRELLKKMTPRK